MLSQVSNLDDIPLCRCLNIILVQGGAFPSSFLPIIFLRRHKTTTYTILVTFHRWAAVNRKISKHILE